MDKMLFLIIFSNILITLHAQNKDCGVCPEGFTYFPTENKCYRGFPDKQTWNNAMKICQKYDSHLLILKDAASNKALNRIIQPMSKSCMHAAEKNPAFWTAGRRNCPGGEAFSWHPVKGVRMNMTPLPWQNGQPHNLFNIEDCIHVVSEKEELFVNDTFCDLANCVICEVDM